MSQERTRAEIISAFAKLHKGVKEKHSEKKLAAIAINAAKGRAKWMAMTKEQRKRRKNMKAKIISLLMLAWLGSSYGAVFGTDCPTIEQQQAAYNRNMAAKVQVRDSASQQLQTHYQQLATYFQQVDKDNQQKCKDKQQIDKDKQQLDFDIYLKGKETAIVQREKECVTKKCENPLCDEKNLPKWDSDGNGGWVQNHCEKWEVNAKGDFLVDGIPATECTKLKAKSAFYADMHYKASKEKFKKDHTNRSGGGDGTNPGGHGNEHGYLNPHSVK